MTRAFSSLGLGLVLAACGAPREAEPEALFAPAPDPAAGPPREMTAPAKPWTQAFHGPALLLAAEIRIEGPDGLLDHVATRVEPDTQEKIEKTVTEGFLQEITVRPGAGATEIHGQLDNLQLVATRRLVVLERPGGSDLVVAASGDAFWTNLETKDEKRGPTLRFVHPIRR
jgi:hypothetical protein